MHVVRIHLVRHHGSDGAGLGDLLGFQAGTLQHVHEVHVAADVKLVRTIQTHTAILEQTGQHAVRDGGADLRLDIVADNRHTSVTELLRPLRGLFSYVRESYRSFFCRIAHESLLLHFHHIRKCERKFRFTFFETFDMLAMLKNVVKSTKNS